MNPYRQDYLDHWLSLARHAPLGILCDLDGTLIPFSSTPAESNLPPELGALLAQIAVLPGVRLTIVSGRRVFAARLSRPDNCFLLT